VLVSNDSYLSEENKMDAKQENKKSIEIIVSHLFLWIREEAICLKNSIKHITKRMPPYVIDIFKLIPMMLKSTLTIWAAKGYTKNIDRKNNRRLPK